MAGMFWACLLVVCYVYVGYPLLAMLLARKSRDVSSKSGYTPTVSILIAAYNEGDEIEATLRNKLAQIYPIEKIQILVVSDESTDDTDNIVRKVAQNSSVPIYLSRQVPRAGKTAGLNMLVPQADGEIIIFSDANSLWDENALAYLVENFADPSVGYVTGKMIYTNVDGTIIGDGCSSFMRFENWLREKETAIGSIVGVDGGIDAMRKSLHTRLRADQLPDFVQPLMVVKKGFRVVYDSRALLKEPALSESSSEYRMRVRVSLRALWAIKDMATLLNPFRYKVFSVQLISHKLLRYLTAIPLVLTFFSNLFLVSDSGFYSMTMLCQFCFYGLALLGFLHRNGPRLTTLPYYFVLLNVAAAVAFWRFLKGQKIVVWQPRVGS